MSFVGNLNEAITSQKEVNFKAGLERVAEYLKTVNTDLRIFVANAQNYGHQASSINILFNLIRMKVPFNFTVIYEDDQNPENTKVLLRRLQVLLPQIKLKGANPPEPITVEGDYEIGFIPFSQPLSQAPLAITGGYDRDVHRLKNLNVDWLLELQPYRWQQDDSQNAIVRGKDQTVISLDDQEYLGGPLFNLLAFNLDVPTTENFQPDQFANNTDWSQYRIPIVRAVLDARKAQTNPVHIWPVYGIATNSLNPVACLANLVGGALLAQSTGMAQSRRLVLLSFANVDETRWELFQHLIEKGETNDTIFTGNAFKQFWTQQKMAKRVKTLHWKDASKIGTAVANLAADEVLVINLNAVPNEVFNYLYATADLPPVFEGQTTANLMLNVGQPYIHLKTGSDETETTYPPLSLTATTPDPVAMALKNVAATVPVYPRAWDSLNTDLPPTALAKFFQEAATPTSGYGTYFRQLGRFYHDPVNDKLRNALIFLADQVKQSQ